MLQLRDDLIFWQNKIFWSAILMVMAYLIKYVWAIIITPDEQSVLVELIMELIALFGAGGVVIGTTKILPKEKSH